MAIVFRLAPRTFVNAEVASITSKTVQVSLAHTLERTDFT